METGLDTAIAPSPAQARALLDAVGGTWFLVYIGGAWNGGVGWTPQLVAAYAAAGIVKFLPCYVGSQQGLAGSRDGILTAAQGYIDGKDAVACLRRFGWLAGPCYLDVEYETATRNQEGAIAYCDGWGVALREAGYRPGVYAPLAFLTRLWQETNRPDAAFPADWLRRGLDHGLDPNHIPGLPDAVFAGARVWQYGGGEGTSVLGTAVDVDVASSGLLLALAPGVTPAPVPASHTYRVVTAHFLRTQPSIVALHAEPGIMAPGELVDANAAPPAGLPSETTSWLWCHRRSTGAYGYALKANMSAAA